MIPPITRRTRLAAAGLIGLVTALIAQRIYAGMSRSAGVGPDFDYFWIAGRALLEGQNPYTALTARGSVWPLYYPLPAVFFMAPFALLPLGAARVAAAGLSAALLSYALSAHAWWRLLWLASGPVLLAVVTGQWAPFLTAAITIVPLRILWALKPTVGLAYWLGWPSRWAVAGGALLWALSFAVLPDWPRYWMQAVREAPAVLAPILLPGGVLLLLALVHWRRAEARYLAALTCVPRTISLYDTVPLGLVPATRRQMLLAVALSQVALVLHVSPAQGGWTRATIYGTWYHELLFIDLPALGLMLYQGRRRAGSPSTTLSASSAS
jgi:hypothetical protein